jgi:hypothetical protein
MFLLGLPAGGAAVVVVGEAETVALEAGVVNKPNLVLVLGVLVVVAGSWYGGVILQGSSGVTVVLQ